MPNYAPDSYRYTVTAYEAEGYENVPSAGDSLGAWAPLNKSKSLNVKTKALYRINIFNNGVIVRDDQGSRLSGDGDFATFKDKVKDIADISSIRTINDRHYDFTVTPKKAGTVSPKLVPQVQINGIWRDVKIQTGSSIPSVIFTKAPTSPQVPTTVTAFDSLGSIGPIQWNSCTQKWLRIWYSNVKEVPIQGKGGTTTQEYTVSIKYFDKNGNSSGADKVISKQVNGKTVNKERLIEAHVPGSITQLAKRLLDEAKNCARPATGGGGGSSTVTPTPETVKKANNFNPYPHLVTRHFAKRVWDTTVLKPGDNVYDQLATFYVDPEVVDLPSDKKAELSKSANLNRFWGFRFLFNPQYISYNMSSNNQVDWTRPNENNAALVASGIGGSITVNILLDRVADMITMRKWKDAGGGSLPIGPYPVTMDEEQCAGILHRGTEYDLEYLFRVLNGNPQEVALMGKNPKDGLELLSANMGYITQLPFIFKVSERLRYKVIMQSISIEHSMFTREMIPIRTVVQIQLERLPDLATGGFKKYAQAEKLNKLGPVLASSPATNPTAAQIIANRRAKFGEI